MYLLQPPLQQRREGPIIKVEIADVKADRSLSIAEDIMRHWKSSEWQIMNEKIPVGLGVKGNLGNYWRMSQCSCPPSLNLAL